MATPAAKNAVSMRRFTPATKSMPRRIAMNTSEVPRSGCFRTRKNGSAT